MNFKKVIVSVAITAAATVGAQSPALYTGNVVMLETWRTGNVAFTLSAAGVPCNGQFILNKSDPGSRNLFAVLVTAKTTERAVTVYFTGCGPAEEYSGTNYALLNYLYLN
jgi:hypothetical protein